MNVGQNIKTFREIKNIKQEALAELVGISQQQLSQIERGKSDVTINLLKKIAENLEVRINELIEPSPFTLYNIMNGTQSGKDVIGNIGSQVNHFTHQAENTDEMLVLLKQIIDLLQKDR